MLLWLKRHPFEGAGLTLMLLSIVWVRYQFLYFESHDYKVFLSLWMQKLQAEGMRAYGYRFTNYTPLYTYFLGLGSAAFPGSYSLYTIKYITFIGEAVAAVFFTSWCGYIITATS